MRRIGMGLVALALAACHLGPRVSSFPPAVDPEGASVEITGRGPSFQAELLAVSDTGLLLLRNRAVVFARYAAIREATFEQVSEAVVGQGVAPDPATRERLRLISRFPQGVSTERLRALLAGYGQETVDVLAP